MVKFHKNSFTIEVQTVGNPIENWLETVKSFSELTTWVNREMDGEINYFLISELLQAMLPDYETAKKMFDEKAE